MRTLQLVFIVDLLKLSGVSPQRPPARDILQSVALAGPSEPPRAETPRDLPVPVQRQAEGGLHKSLPL